MRTRRILPYISRRWWDKGGYTAIVCLGRYREHSSLCSVVNSQHSLTCSQTNREDLLPFHQRYLHNSCSAARWYSYPVWCNEHHSLGWYTMEQWYYSLDHLSSWPGSLWSLGCYWYWRRTIHYKTRTIADYEILGRQSTSCSSLEHPVGEWRYCSWNDFEWRFGL